MKPTASMKALRKIYDNLIAGGVYGYMVTDVRYPYFHEVLFYDGTYFCWCSYGSSANKATIGDLEWMIHNIFKETPVSFCSKYELRREAK